MCATSHSVCTEADSDDHIYSVTIERGGVDSSGPWVDVTGLGVTIATNGNPHLGLRQSFQRQHRKRGAWSAWQYDEMKKVDASALEFMGVDGAHAFAPTETWTNADGKARECTEDYAVSYEK